MLTRQYLTQLSAHLMGIRTVGLLILRMTTGVPRQVKVKFTSRGLEKGTGGRITLHSITDHLLIRGGFRLK